MTGTPDFFVQVLLDMPIGERFDYRAEPDQVPLLAPGAWVVVPWAQTRRVGLVIAVSGTSELPPERVRTVLQVLADAPRLAPDWFEFLAFVASYYHRPLGEVALPALPKLLRSPPAPCSITKRSSAWKPGESVPWNPSAKSLERTESKSTSPAAFRSLMHVPIRARLKQHAGCENVGRPFLTGLAKAGARGP